MARRALSVLLFTASFGVAGSLTDPCAAQSRGEGAAIAGIGILISQSVLLPGYISTIYYAVRDDKSMPGGWLAGNIVSSAGAISVGIVSLYTSTHYNGSSDGVLYVAGGGAALLGAGVVLFASGFQFARDEEPSPPLIGPKSARLQLGVAPSAGGGALTLSGLF